MTKDKIRELIDKNIHSYASAEILKFEKQMTRYFEREYKRWQGNKKLPEDYGISSFEGEIAKKETLDVSVSHYDEEYEVYRAFLDSNYMAYTMGYYGATDKVDLLQNVTLEQAQVNKYKLIAERAEIQDGQRILDLGCGFGGLSKYLLETFPNINIIAINPSEIQVNHIRNELIKKDDLFDESRFKLIQAYFDTAESVSINKNSLDRVISVGMLEHVTNIDLLQKNISFMLKKGGKCFHHCIVSYDVIPQYLNAETTIMGAYYPGAHIWPYNEPRRHNNHLLLVNSWFVNGMNYWKTLDEWHQRFWDNINELYPSYLTVEEVDNWNKYFSLCKTMFSPNSGKSYGNGHYLYEKK